jgi:hypothetical protein
MVRWPGSRHRASERATSTHDDRYGPSADPVETTSVELFKPEPFSRTNRQSQHERRDVSQACHPQAPVDEQVPQGLSVAKSDQLDLRV